MKRLRALLIAGCLIASALLPSSVAANTFQTNDECYAYRNWTNIACINENAFGDADGNLIQNGLGGQYHLTQYIVQVGDGICAGIAGAPDDWNDCISSVYLNLNSGVIFCAYEHESLGGRVTMARYGPLLNKLYNFNSTFNDLTSSFRITTAANC